jgi:hypothetical protein
MSEGGLMREEGIREDERRRIAARICGRCAKAKPFTAAPGVDYPKKNGGTVSTHIIHKDGRYFTGCPAQAVWSD